MQLIFAVIVTFVVWGCPESPRWLAKRGREKEAVEVLCAVFDLPEDDEYIVGEMEAIRAAINVEKGEGSAAWTSVFKKDILQTRWRVFLAWFGLFMNQWSGINLVSENLIPDFLQNMLIVNFQGRLLHAYSSTRKCRLATQRVSLNRWFCRAHVPNRKLIACSRPRQTRTAAYDDVWSRCSFVLYDDDHYCESSLPCVRFP